MLQFARTASFAEMCRQVHIAKLKLVSIGSVANRRNQPFRSKGPRSAWSAVCEFDL